MLLSRILQKVRSDEANALLVAPDWPGQPWYTQIQLMLTGAPYPLPKVKSLLSLPFDQEAVHALWRSLNLTVWPVSGQPTRRQVSPKVTNVLLASWSQSTKKRYQGPWWAWSNWCSSRGLCPFSAPVTDVLTFLTETMTNQSLEYRTLAVYKSAISQGHLPVGQTKLGDLPVVSRFMKGIFRMKPPTPRLSSTWDVKRLLEFLATLDLPADLTVKMLSFKLALLLALTSSARAHELIKLDLDFVSIKSDSWEFSLAAHTKESRPGHLARKIYLPAFPDNPKICVVKTLQEYRSRTETRRQSSCLLISFVRPFKPISSQTMCRWLRKAMQLAVIDCHFTGHSTRSASTSAAARAGVRLDSILVAADWSSSETFKRFYPRSSDKGSLQGQ